MREVERFQVVVIGGGQAGLAAGYHLKRAGLSFVILEAHQRLGDVWRERWQSLRLFSPARYSGLPGLPFPGRSTRLPTRSEMADYLASYAAHFSLPVETGVQVTRVSRDGDGYLVEMAGRRMRADQVIVATGNYHHPRVPAFAAELDGSILQFHSSAYRDPAQLRPGNVLVVGAGNSGSEIALEVSRRLPTSLAGREVPQVPFRPGSFAGRNLLVHLMRAFGHYGLTLDTRLGRKLRPKLLHAATPLVPVKHEDLAAAGVARVPRVVGVEQGRPRLEDGQVLDVANIIWCTGFKPAFDWIDLPIFDEQGDPRHHRGVVAEAPGLYFLGLHFQYSITSALINGVGRDAGYVVGAVGAHARVLAAGASRRAEPASRRPVAAAIVGE